MKKTTRTLLLALGTLLLLGSVTVGAHAQEANQFNGTWNTITSKGIKILITLKESRPGTVVGTYSPIHGLTTGSHKPLDGSIFGFQKVSASTAEPALQSLGRIRGYVKDNALIFTWHQDDAQGAGRFTLSSDGESFEGSFSATSNPDDTSGGTWNGTRRYSFTGAWQGKLGDGVLQLMLQQAGDQVMGQLRLNSAEFVIREGSVGAGNTLRFKVVRPGRPMLNGRLSPDEYLGTGELVMDKGGKSCKGTVLGSATSGTLVGR